MPERQENLAVYFGPDELAPNKVLISAPIEVKLITTRRNCRSVKGVVPVAITCPRCKRQYDITLFEFGRRIVCDCGEIIAAHGSAPPAQPNVTPAPTPDELKQAKLIARRKMARLRRAADRVCTLILISDYPEIDIELEKVKVRQLAEELFPDRMDLYEMVYESRFRRLWEQFRTTPDEGGAYDIWRRRF
jgi:hypothetical protein